MQSDGRAARGTFLDFRDILSVVRQHRNLIGRSAGIGLILGLLYLVFTPSKYTATAEVLFETRLQNVSGIEAVLPGLNTDRALIDSQLEILASRQVFDRALAIFLGGKKKPSERDDGRNPGPSRKSVTWQPVKNELTEIAEAASQEIGRLRLMDRLKIRRRGLSYIADITFTDRSPNVAAKMANAVADAYIATRREEKASATQWAVAQLSGRVDQVRERVRSAFATVQKFRTSNNLYKVGELELSERHISDQIERLVAAKARAVQAESVVLQMKQLKGDPTRLMTLDKVLASDVILEFRRQFAEVQRRLGQARNRLGDKHESVAAARAELDKINLEIRLEVDRIAKNSRNELEMAKIQVSLLDDGLEKLKLDYARQNQARNDLTELERQAAADQQLYISLLNRLRETQVQVGMQTDDARLIFYASPPEQRSWPKRRLTLALTLSGGIFIGLLLAFGRETLNKIFRSPRDVERLTAFTPIAILPEIVLSRMAKVRNLMRGRYSPSLSHAIQYPTSTFTRSIFELGYWVEQIEPKRSARVVMIASAQEGDGKTTIASNLAHFIATRGKRVVLVDCDPHHGDLSSGLGHDPSVAFEDNDISPQPELVKLDQSNLDLHLASPSVSKISTGRMAHLLTEMSADFDFLILDTSALLSSTDTYALIEHVDCAVFVMRSGVTTVQEFEGALEQTIRYAKFPIGVVLNMAGSEVLTTPVQEGTPQQEAAVSDEKVKGKANALTTLLRWFR